MSHPIIRPDFLGPDVCQDGYLSLSKGLLNSVDPGRPGIEVYHDYFIPFALVSDDSNLSCLRRRPRMEIKVRNTMFKRHEPKADPAFFNFKSHHDVNRLSKMLNSEIVIYFATRNWSVVEVYHDFRILTASSSHSRLKSIKYFLLTEDKTLHQCEVSLDHLVKAASYFFAVPGSCFKFKLKHQPGFLENLSGRLEGASRPDFEISSLGQLSNACEGLVPFWSNQGAVVIVAFCRSLFLLHKSRIYRRKEPKFSYFITLGLVLPDSDDGSPGVVTEKLLSTEVKIFCVFADDSCCLLLPEFGNMVLQNLVRSNSKTKDSPMHNDYLGSFRLPKNETERAVYERDVRRRKKKSNNIDKFCKCVICSSEDFNLNMSQGGPENLLTVELEVRDILKLLGQLDEKHERLIEEMCELSLASMDLESMTVDADLVAPNTTGAAKYAEIGDSYLEDHVKKIQKPIMIAHVDALGMENSTERILLTAKSDSEESIYDMMIRYWKKVLRLKKKSSRKKRQLAAPLLALVQEYKNSYFACASQHFQELERLNAQIPDCQEESKACPKNLTLAWWQMLPGKLERALNKLIGQYNVFSFYG